MAEDRLFPAGYDVWIVQAVSQISNRIWDFTSGQVDLAARGGNDMQEIAEIIRKAALVAVPIASSVVESGQVDRVFSLVVTFGNGRRSK
jgi:hypothetical protein